MIRHLKQFEIQWALFLPRRQVVLHVEEPGNAGWLAVSFEQAQHMLDAVRVAFRSVSPFSATIPTDGIGFGRAELRALEAVLAEALASARRFPEMVNP